MNRARLLHVLRAASQIVEGGEILVIGSQAILGSYGEDVLPDRATLSGEADIAFFDDPDAIRSDRVDGAIGEGSLFHRTYGYYGQGVSVSTATLPAGWRERTVPYAHPNAGTGMAVCLEAHDLVVSKLAAGREKDYEFAQALIEADLIALDVLTERVDDLEECPPISKSTRATL